MVPKTQKQQPVGALAVAQYPDPVRYFRNTYLIDIQGGAMRVLKALLLAPLVVALNGCLGLRVLNPVLPKEVKPEQIVGDAVEPKPEAEPAEEKENFFGAAVNTAMAAAEGAQTAKSPEAWKAVAELWEQAIKSMEAVPPDDKNYSVAQQKAKEYQTNLDYARQSSGLTAIPYTVLEVVGAD